MTGCAWPGADPMRCDAEFGPDRLGRARQGADPGIGDAGKGGDGNGLVWTLCPDRLCPEWFSCVRIGVVCPGMDPMPRDARKGQDWRCAARSGLVWTRGRVLS